jgi:hypothetical protein
MVQSSSTKTKTTLAYSSTNDFTESFLEALENFKETFDEQIISLYYIGKEGYPYLRRLLRYSMITSDRKPKMEEQKWKNKR